MEWWVGKIKSSPVITHSSGRCNDNRWSIDLNSSNLAVVLDGFGYIRDFSILWGYSFGLSIREEISGYVITQGPTTYFRFGWSEWLKLIIRMVGSFLRKVLEEYLVLIFLVVKVGAILDLACRNWKRN